MNHCLKFPDVVTAIGAMPQFWGENEWIKASHTHALDPIGMLHAETGKMLVVDGIATPETAPLAGWHCNLVVAELPPELAQFEVFPVTAKRVWA